LLVLLLLLATLSVALVTLFDTGQLAIRRMQLANAADAAALTAAVVEARGLNFAASMNRAIVANEAAIAQSVSLRSWSAYMRRLLGNVGILTAWVPYLAPVTEALRRFWTGFDTVLQPSLEGAEAAFALAIPALSAAETVLVESSGLAAADALRRSLAANRPEARLSRGGELLVARSLAGSPAFTERLAGARRDRHRAVINAARDQFVRERNRRLSPPLAGALVRFERRGGTELLGDGQWRGLDTLSLHARRGVVFGRWRERVPLGWGAAANGANTALRGTHGGSARINPRATTLAQDALRSASSYRGVAAIHELSMQAATDRPRRLWALRVVEPRESLPLAARLLGITSLPRFDGDEIDTIAALPGGGAFATAAAEVFFERYEQRRDGRYESASLFNPYWRARLTRLPATDRALAWAVDGTPDPLAGITP
jgi:hypothetical protein